MPTLEKNKINVIAGIGLILMGISIMIGLLPLLLIGVFLVIGGLIMGGEDRWKCDYCDERFKHKNQSIQHEKKHEKKKGK